MELDVLAVSGALAGFIILASHHVPDLTGLVKRKLIKETPQQLIWKPRTRDERSVYAALFTAGKPVSNQELADILGVSPGECSKRVTAVEPFINKKRIGRRVLISLAA